jgi:hypothetical protein
MSGHQATRSIHVQASVMAMSKTHGVQKSRSNDKIDAMSDNTFYFELHAALTSISSRLVRPPLRATWQVSTLNFTMKA